MISNVIRPPIPHSIRNGGSKPWEGADRPGPVYLLDYHDATFVRAAVATYWDESILHEYAGGEARILSDGSIFGERTGTNLLLRSSTFDHATWTKTGSATIGADATTDPTNKTSVADSLILTADADDGVSQTFTGTNDLVYTFSVFLKVASGTEDVIVRILNQDATTTDSTATATTSWQRFSVSSDIASGATPEACIIVNSSADARTVFAFGAQVELGVEPSSYIATTTATSTRNNEIIQFAATPTAMLSGTWAMDITPLVGYPNPNGNGRHFYAGFESAAVSTMEILQTDGTLRVDDGGVTKVTGAAITYSAGQRMTFTISPKDGSIRVFGATTGDALTVGTAWAYANGSMGIGNRPTGSQSGFSAIYSRPRLVT